MSMDQLEAIFAFLGVAVAVMVFGAGAIAAIAELLMYLKRVHATVLAHEARQTPDENAGGA